METKTLRNTIYTVTRSERGWKNDRTIHSLTGPRGGEYTLVEFDGSFRILTDMANGRSRKWHEVLDHATDTAVVHAEEMLPTPALETDHLESQNAEASATLANARARIDANLTALLEAVDAWTTVDREDVHAVSNVASDLCCISRNLSAYAGDIAQVVSRREWRHA